jgi:hypothetical protein
MTLLLGETIRYNEYSKSGISISGSHGISASLFSEMYVFETALKYFIFLVKFRGSRIISIMLACHGTWKMAS